MWKAISAGLIVGATAVLVHAPAASQGGDRGPDNDPNKMICENQTEIGSRVSRRRVCRTRAEWDAHRAEQRKTTERVQYFKPSCERPPCG